jgi:hypothetical protein
MARARLHNRIDLMYTGEYEEARAAAVIRPGELIAIDADGNVVPHASAGVCYAVLVAIQNQKLGVTVDTAYAIGDLVPYIIPKIGDVLAILVESAETPDFNEFLTATATGTLKVATSTDHRIFQPLEEKAGTGSADMLMKVRRVA